MSNKNVKTLSIIMNSDENNRFAWSGVNYFIIKSLKKHFQVQYFKATAHYSILAKLLLKLDKIFHKNAKEYPIIVNHLLYRKCIKEAEKSSDMVLTTISTFAAYSKKCIYVVDAVYRSLLNYYYFDVNKIDAKRLDSIQRRALKRSKKIIFASDWARNEANKIYRIEMNKSYVALMGANIEDIKTSPKSISHKREIQFFFMGADYERKGLSKIIDLIELLNIKDTNHKYSLNVVGKYADNTDMVKYYGFLKKTNEEDYKKYIDLYKYSDFFISMPRAECFGIVYCESSMFYLPSISIDTGGISSYLKNNENGLLFKQDDSLDTISSEIIRLVNDDNRYKKISKKSRALYERDYNWNKWAERVASIINDDCN